MTHHPYDALLLECAGLRARIAELESARDEARRHLTVERARAKFLDSECTRRLEMLQARRAELDKLESEVDRLRAGGCARDQGATQFCAEAVDALRRLREEEEEVEIKSVYARGLQTQLDASAARIAELENELQSDHHCHMMHASERARIAELEADLAKARNGFEEAKNVLRGAVKDLESDLAEARSETIAALERAVKLEAEVERLRAALPARVRMDPQPPDWPGMQLEAAHGRIFTWFAVAPKVRGLTLHVAPAPNHVPVRDPDGTWYWELRPAAQGEEGKP